MNKPLLEDYEQTLLDRISLVDVLSALDALLSECREIIESTMDTTGPIGVRWSPC